MASKTPKTGAKKEVIPQLPQILVFIPPTKTKLRQHPSATGGYKWRRGITNASDS